jgi:Immunity protein Imm1
MTMKIAEIIASPASGERFVCKSLPGGCIEVSDETELRGWLKRIAIESPRPLLVQVGRRDGDLLSVGLGRSQSFLTYIPKGGSPPYFSVVSDAPEDEELCFDSNGEPSFYSTRNTVPFDVAIEVVCVFVQTSGKPLPESVMWEQI